MPAAALPLPLLLALLSLAVCPTSQKILPSIDSKAGSSQSSSDGSTQVISRLERGATAGVAPCSDGQPYCDSAPDYPKDKIKRMLKSVHSSYVISQLNLEESGESHFELSGNSNDIIVEADLHDKGHFGGTEQPLCVSEPKIIYPQKAKARDGTYQFIVNDDEYKQGVKVETCSSKNNEGGCRLPGSLPLNYSSYCAQKHILRSLVVLDKASSDGAGFITKPFEFPSCCSCVIVSG